MGRRYFCRPRGSGDLSEQYSKRSAFPAIARFAMMARLVTFRIAFRQCRFSPMREWRSWATRMSTGNSQGKGLASAAPVVIPAQAGI